MANYYKILQLFLKSQGKNSLSLLCLFKVKIRIPFFFLKDVYIFASAQHGRKSVLKFIEVEDIIEQSKFIP